LLRTGTKWLPGGSDWAAPITAVQDDGEEERGWAIQSRCEGDCQTIRRIEFALSTQGSDDGNGRLAMLGSTDAGRAGAGDVGVYADLSGVWTHVAATYDGSTMKLFVDGVAMLEDQATASGAIVYPSTSYQSQNGGWFTIGAYHDANEYFTWPGVLDELKVWHVALTAPQLGCSDNIMTHPDLSYYWQFDDNEEGELDGGMVVRATKGLDGISSGGSLAVVDGWGSHGGCQAMFSASNTERQEPTADGYEPWHGANASFSIVAVP